MEKWCESEELAQWLKALATLAEDLSSIPALTSGGSQMQVTPRFGFQ